jgi:hypothetical protein
MAVRNRTASLAASGSYKTALPPYVPFPFSSDRTSVGLATYGCSDDSASRAALKLETTSSISKAGQSESRLTERCLALLRERSEPSVHPSPLETEA